MNRNTPRVLFGLLAIIGGLVMMAQNLGWIGQITNPFIAVALFLVLGLSFVAWFAYDRRQWWAIIPGGTLLSVATLITCIELSLVSSRFGGSIILAGLGLTFVAVYLVRRTFWWAIIPAGVLLSLAGVVVVDEYTRFEEGAVFLVGLGLTFALLSFMRIGERRMIWAAIPATILVGLGVLVAFDAVVLASYLWPVVLVGFGLFLIWRGMRHDNAQHV